jgi:hypothetical protein
MLEEVTAERGLLRMREGFEKNVGGESDGLEEQEPSTPGAIVVVGCSFRLA